MMFVSMNLSKAYSACLRSLCIESHLFLGKPFFSLWRPDSTPLLALPGCAPMQQYLLPFSVNTWFCVPLANDCCCVDAHDLIALHMLQPSFIIPSNSFLESCMMTGDVSSGQMRHRPSEALIVSATHKLPSRIQRQYIPLQDEFGCMASSAVSPPSHTTIFFLILSEVIN